MSLAKETAHSPRASKYTAFGIVVARLEARPGALGEKKIIAIPCGGDGITPCRVGGGH